MTPTLLIPQLSFICMGFTAIICIAVPLIALFAFKNRYHARIQSFFMGAITYVIFAFVFKSFSNEFFLSGTSNVSQAILGNPYYFALYSALAAGIFEELGRYFCLAFLMKYSRKEDAVLYGLGHGGIEAVVAGSWTMVQNIIIGMALNRFGSIETYASQAGTPEEAENITSFLTKLVGASSGEHLLAGAERIGFLIVQVSLSVLIFKAITRKKTLYIPLAILLHVLISFISALYQTGAFTNHLVIALLILVCAAAVGMFGYRQYQSLKYEEY